MSETHHVHNSRTSTAALKYSEHVSQFLENKRNMSTDAIGTLQPFQMQYVQGWACYVSQTCPYPPASDLLMSGGPFHCPEVSRRGWERGWGRQRQMPAQPGSAILLVRSADLQEREVPHLWRRDHYFSYGHTAWWELWCIKMLIGTSPGSGTEFRNNKRWQKRKQIINIIREV